MHSQRRVPSGKLVSLTHTESVGQLLLLRVKPTHESCLCLGIEYLPVESPIGDGIGHEGTSQGTSPGTGKYLLSCKLLILLSRLVESCMDISGNVCWSSKCAHISEVGQATQVRISL